MVGPFGSPPLPMLHISPLGIVSKKAMDECQLIYHLSHPRGSSVNDGIAEELVSVHYTSFDSAVGMVSRCGRGILLGKCNIKSAFHLLPIHLGDFDLLGFQFGDSIFMDVALPMGCSISCSAFEKNCTFLEWAFHKSVATFNVVHYLDDFLFAGRKDTAECLEFMHIFQQLATDELGVPLAAKKTEGPTT